jgi:hypothetical protein
MITQDTFFGGSHIQSLSSNYTLHVQFARLYQLRGTVSGVEVTLPNYTLSGFVWKSGSPFFLIYNFGSTYALTIKKHDGTTVYTLAAGEAVEIDLENTSTDPNAGSASWAWSARKRLKMT